MHWQRHVLVSECHLALVFRLQFLQGGRHLLAVRAFVIRKLHKLDRSIVRTENGCIVQCDLGSGCGQRNQHVRLAKKTLHVRSFCFLKAGLPDVIQNLSAHSLEGLGRIQAFVINAQRFIAGIFRKGAFDVAIQS